jgi:hypothetical protein
MEQPESLSILKMNYHSEDLHRKFNSITALLTLVTAINNRGHPILSGHSAPYQTLLDRNLPEHKKVLNAIATLLVQDAEVVAVAGCNPFPNGDSGSGQQGSYQVWAVQQSPQVNHTATHDLDPAIEGIDFGFSGKSFSVAQLLLP